MQPLAAYYLFIANEEARAASTRRPYRSIPLKRSARVRLGSALQTLLRPARRSASAV
jgi:hypothetical protein